MSQLERKLLPRLRQTISPLVLAAVSVFAAAQSVPSNSPAKPLAFEVATIRPSPPDSTNEEWDGQGDRLMIRGYSLRQLIKAAFDLKTNAQIMGGPEWIDKQRFDISAKIADEEMSSSSEDSADRDRQTDIRFMLQTLLQERFKLEWKFVQRQLPIFALVMSGNKPHLIPDASRPRNLSVHNAHMVAIATSTKELAEALARMREVSDRSVVDQTGLNGRFDFELNWSPDRGSGIPQDAPYPGLFTALEEQLGLRLKPQKGSVPTVQIVTATLPDFD
jgi:uncharacterized protein (TIGR03435 family)